MCQSIIHEIDDPGLRKELSDKLAEYVDGASRAVVDLTDIPEEDRKLVSEILMERIYIPLMMGENKAKVRPNNE